MNAAEIDRETYSREDEARKSALRKDAGEMIERAIAANLPDAAVKRVLRSLDLGSGRLVVLSIGKAAWNMAHAAAEALSDRAPEGLVVTKYGHARGALPNFEVIEAGHPIPDENSVRAAKRALAMVSGLTVQDTVLVLLSGGGSSLFEDPKVSPEVLQEINRQLVACGAGIREINMIRKRLSYVKGGRLAKACEPARVIGILLSDIVGDQLDMIASGPTCEDHSTSAEVEAVIDRYRLSFPRDVLELLKQPPVRLSSRTENHICGSPKQLCEAAMEVCRQMGYQTLLLTDSLECEARSAGIWLAGIGRYYAAKAGGHCAAEGSGDRAARGGRYALVAGGETVVRVTGTGKGGRNQEMALAAAAGIAGLENVLFFSVGSDGTDGPTDAAGGMVDGRTHEKLLACGISEAEYLKDHDAYHALERVGGLIMTGPTGTNVCDLSILLIG